MKRPRTPSVGAALRHVRRARGLAQEQFDQVSSRTYVSAIERGVKQPTVSKMAELAGVLGVHPLTLLTLSFAHPDDRDGIDRLLLNVGAEIAELLLPAEVG